MKIGFVGAPGVGKTTLSRKLLERLNANNPIGGSYTWLPEPSLIQMGLAKENYRGPVSHWTSSQKRCLDCSRISCQIEAEKIGGNLIVDSSVPTLLAYLLCLSGCSWDEDNLGNQLDGWFDKGKEWMATYDLFVYLPVERHRDTESRTFKSEAIAYTLQTIMQDLMRKATANVYAVRGIEIDGVISKLEDYISIISKRRTRVDV